MLVQRFSRSMSPSRLFFLLVPLVILTAIGGLASANPGAPNCDINGDGVLNLLDVALFAVTYLSGVYSANVDLNCDGVVNLADVGLFATCW